MYSCLDMISETQHDKVYVVGVCVNHFIQNIYLCYYYSTRITRIRAKSLFQLYTTSPKRCFQTIFWLKFDFSLFSYFSWITHFFLFFMNNTLFSLFDTLFFDIVIFFSFCHIFHLFVVFFSFRCIYPFEINR